MMSSPLANVIGPSVTAPVAGLARLASPSSSASSRGRFSVGAVSEGGGGAASVAVASAAATGASATGAAACSVAAASTAAASASVIGRGVDGGVCGVEGPRALQFGQQRVTGRTNRARERARARARETTHGWCYGNEE
jgi:hypothetical protein